jgi:acyl-CoA thioesterase-1
MAGYSNTTRVVVALGASNTAGYGVGAEYAYPKCIERLLRKRQIAAEVINSGVSGNTTGEMLARLERDVPAGTCVVLFQPGSNDERRGIPVRVRERNIATITARLGKRGILVIRVAPAFETARLGNLQRDGIHYTKAGHALIARLLVDEVARALGFGDLPRSRS